ARPCARRRALARRPGAHRGGRTPMSQPIQLVAIVASLALVVLVLDLIRRQRIKEELWFAWLVASLGPLACSLWLAPWAAAARRRARSRTRPGSAPRGGGRGDGRACAASPRDRPPG